MKASHVFYLLFRYVTLIILGFSISYLWRICRLEDYESWGKFYALWIPMLYAIFSTGYLLLGEYCTRHVLSSGTHAELDKRFVCFLRYDDYTYLFPLGVLGLEIATPYLTNLFLWLSISYLALVIIKTTLFLMFFYEHVRQASGQAHSHSRVPLYIQVTLFLTALVVYALISGYHIHRTTTTGDEPHYLLITHSLWHDYDTNLYNNYNNRDYESFYWYELKPSWGDQSRKDETKIYSYRHKGGFPHTLIPGYVLGGQLGVTLQINLISALLMLQVFLLSYELFQSLTASFFTWICMAFTIPVIIYMGQIYPDTLAAFLTIWGVRRIRMLHPGDSLFNSRFWKNCMYSGIMLMVLVLLKTRYVPVAGTLILFLISHLFQKRISSKHKVRIIASVALMLLLGMIAVFLVDKFLLGGKFWDRITDPEYMAWLLKNYNPLFGFLGFWFDQEYGLFPYSPLYILAFAGIGALTRKELKTVLPIFGIFFLNYLILSFLPLWHAAPTPPSRYILPFLPLLGVFFAKFFTQKGHFIRVVVLGLCSIWSALSAWVVTITPQWRYNWADGTNNLLEMLSWRLSMNLTKIFPSWTRISPLTPYLTLLGIVCIGVIMYACRREARNSAKFLSQHLSTENKFLVIVGLFITLLCGGFIIAKFLPSSGLEAEDLLDFRTFGGERIPRSLDPWNNQIYLREWKYYGWEMNPGDRLQTRPTLYRLFPVAKSGKKNEWDLQIYARAQKEGKPEDFPVMRILINKKKLGQITVSSTNWNVYHFKLIVNETRPLLEIIYQRPLNSKRTLIIDKVRFH